MLDTSSWKEFRIGNWFEQIGSTALIKNFDKKDSPQSEFVVPALSSKTDNNSFGFFVREKDHELIDRICLSVTLNGDAGKIYVQNAPFAIAQDAYAIFLKEDIEGYDKEKVYLFLATTIEKVLRQKYGYTNKATWNKIKDEKIKLPAKLRDSDETYEPDWAYMEEYIKYIEDKYIERVDEQNKKRIKEALSYCGLSEKDLEGELKLPEVERYEEFRIGDWFDTESGDTDIKQEDIDNKGEITITSGIDNYGMLGRTDVKAKVISKDTITIDMFGNIFYRPYNYKMVTHARVFALIPKFKMNYRISLFICSVLFYLKGQYSYSHMCSYNKIKREILSLPAIDKNTPDFETMETYIYIYIYIY